MPTAEGTQRCAKNAAFLEVVEQEKEVCVAIGGDRKTRGKWESSKKHRANPPGARGMVLVVHKILAYFYLPLPKTSKIYTEIEWIDLRTN